MQYKSFSEFMTEGLSQGFSAECAVAGILLCSCVLCRRQTRNGHESEQCEKGIKIKEQNTTQGSHWVFNTARKYFTQMQTFDGP